MSEPVFAAVASPYIIQSRGRGIRRLADACLLKALSLVLKRARSGRLHLRLPSGLSAIIGAGEGVEARLAIKRYSATLKLINRGLLGFADAFINEDVETDDLRAVFQYFLDNETAITSRLPQLMRSAGRDVAYHASRHNTRSGSQRNIAAHYDLGNAFYELWLDAGMSYSSGIYRQPGATLEEAQAAKHARIIEALGLEAGQAVLEIGCGWGALAEEIAAQGAHVTAITISEQQLEASRRRLAPIIDAGRADVRFEDYRDTRGSFDRIASIEMIEAVGEENWPTYFRTIHERLKPGGCAVVQAITIREDLYEPYRRNPDFIQRYIFPGGMLPSIPRMRAHAEQSGLVFSEIERFGDSYAQTIAEWRRRFIAAWPRIEALGFDERFRRTWLYYLDYCEVGFRNRTIDVGLYRFERT
ncbi:MAG: cyclopropane-fatty-acyl-phospholipid synthase family protein [Hyphomicrobiaceae bacterium]